MKYQIGDIVKCPPSGPHAGPRIGKVIQVNKNFRGQPIAVVRVKYIDYPQEDFGWSANHKDNKLPIGVWCTPLSKIVITEIK